MSLQFFQKKMYCQWTLSQNQILAEAVAQGVFLGFLFCFFPVSACPFQVSLPGRNLAKR